ncbi:ABC transporter substrate-binding protein [Roseiterribacter gracilis]|uniref:ABC transporter substrate-binding protein n=1 Tax=Roseiterribacter gracilis TaxID=2812848 RepID=UPI003B435E0F
MNRVVRRLALAALLVSSGASAQTSTPQTSAPTTLNIVANLTTGWVRNFNPFNETTRLHSVREFVYEPLVVFNAMHNGRPHFRLATNFDFSPNLLKLTFTLRDGVKWSDGQAFTSKDVAFTFELLRKFRPLDTLDIWDRISAVETPDAHTVVFTLKRVNANMAYEVVRVPIVAEHVWSKVADPVTFTNENPVGTGPMTEVRRFTSQVYTQCRNPNYWDAAHLKVECLSFPQVGSNEQLLIAAAAGSIDWFGAFLPDIERTYVAADPQHHRYWFPPGGTVAININFDSRDAGNRAAFRNVNFRRAVSMAIDRRAIVDIAGYGYPIVNEYASGLGRTYQDWTNAEAERKYSRFTKFDKDAARALLAESGFRDVNGDGFVENPDGSPISFYILAPNGWTDWVNSSQLVAEGLNAIGINARVSTPEPAAWTQKLISGNYDMAINAYLTGETPHRSLDMAFHSRHVGKSRFAATRFTDPELDTALNNFIATIDPVAQRQAMDRVQMILAANTPYVPLFSNPIWYEYNTRRFKGWFNADNPVARPDVFDGTPERLLHLLAIEPVGNS